MQIGLSGYFAADNRTGTRGSIIFLISSSSAAKINQHRSSTFFSDVNLLLLSPPGSQLQTNTFVTTDRHIDQAPCDMARAETMESAVSGGDAGASGGRASSLPHHITCRMELPRAALYLPCPPLPWFLHPGAVEGPQEEEEEDLRPASPSSSSPSSSPPPSPSYSQSEERGGGGETPPSAYSSGDQLRGERTDSDKEESLEASSLGRGPLPDLLPENEHPSWPPVPRHRPPVAEAGLELEARRVGRQLRAIGDDLNTALLYRAAAPQWRDWRGVCQVLINFVSETLSTLYRLT